MLYKVYILPSSGGHNTLLPRGVQLPVLGQRARGRGSSTRGVAGPRVAACSVMGKIPVEEPRLTLLLGRIQGKEQDPEGLAGGASTPKDFPVEQDTEGGTGGAVPRGSYRGSSTPEDLPGEQDPRGVTGGAGHRGSYRGSSTVGDLPGEQNPRGVTGGAGRRGTCRGSSSPREAPGEQYPRGGTG